MDTIPTTKAERELPDLIHRAPAGETIIIERRRASACALSRWQRLHGIRESVRTESRAGSKARSRYLPASWSRCRKTSWKIGTESVIEDVARYPRPVPVADRRFAAQ
jgi:antitoxin (DNA-binding transcriptional repressor) of toxin-antitoxin stability system